MTRSETKLSMVKATTRTTREAVIPSLYLKENSFQEFNLELYVRIYFNIQICVFDPSIRPCNISTYKQISKFVTV